MATSYPSRLEVFTKLEQLGFKNHKDIGEQSWIFHRRMPGTERHQTVVKFFDFLLPGNDRRYVSFELETTFETKDSIWANVKYYSLSFEDLLKYLDRLEANLRKVIEPMEGDPQSYTLMGEDA